MNFDMKAFGEKGFLINGTIISPRIVHQFNGISLYYFFTNGYGVSLSLHDFSKGLEGCRFQYRKNYTMNRLEYYSHLDQSEIESLLKSVYLTGIYNRQ